jgi:hypothetical protein
MAKQPHTVWKIFIASLDDARILKQAGRRAYIVDLPTHRTYFIEAKHCGAAEKKALKLAIDEGITNPTSKGAVNCRFLSHSD